MHIPQRMAQRKQRTTHVRVHAHVHVRVRVHVRIDVHVRVRVHMRVRVDVHVHVRAHAHHQERDAVCAHEPEEEGVRRDRERAPQGDEDAARPAAHLLPALRSRSCYQI